MTATSSTRERLLGTTRLRLIQGDLTSLAADAIALYDERALGAFAAALADLP